jgi:hypothetical protein
MRRQYSQKLFFLLLCLLMIGCSGCIIPCPHFKQTCSEIQGIVVDEQTKAPVSNASININYVDGGSRETKTDQKGYFLLSPKYRFHWGILFGVALNHSLPFDEYMGSFSEITIEAEGYEQGCLYEKWRQDRHPELTPLQAKYLYKDKTLIYPEISIKRKI